MRYDWIAEQKKAYPLEVLCRALNVSRSGFLRHQRTRARRQVVALQERAIAREVHRESRGVYGSRRLAAALTARGVPTSRGRARRLMRVAGLRSKHPKPYRVTTVRDGSRSSPDLVARNFTADRPNQTWVTDITYVQTSHGWLFLCVMIDLYSRKVVGWALEPVIDTRLVLRAFRRAERSRRPPAGLVVHSDQGCQYTSRAFRDLLEQSGYRSSMGAVGSCWDNAVAESFFATLKKESAYSDGYLDEIDAAGDIGGYIETFYNPVRLHSSLGNQAPSRFEAKQPELARAA